MKTQRLQPPDLKIVAVEPAPGQWRQWFKSGSAWMFRTLLLGLIVGAIAYNQYALTSVVKMVEELKKGLLLKDAEIPIEQTLEKKGLKWRGDHILFDPVANVALGTEYLVYLANEFRGERQLRAAYQQGPARARHIRGGETYVSNP